jgi:hypothetical protein
MLLDEFTALGHIPIVAEAISYLPGPELQPLFGRNPSPTMSCKAPWIGFWRR